MFMEKPKILIAKNIIETTIPSTEDIAEKNIKNKLKKEILEDIKQGLLLEISKKEKDTYTYFSKNTLSTLLFLSKTNISYPFPLENLMDKNDFAEFYYDLDYTDLKAVFWININNRRENLYKHYETFLEHQGQIEGKILDVERTMPVELLNLFYDNIKDCDIGLYSTEESLFQYLLFKKYNIKKSKKRRTEKDVKDYGLYNFIKYEPKFVSNQIADDILKEYIDDFENCKLNEDRRTLIINPYTEEELTEIDKIDKSKLTEKEKTKRLEKFYPKEIDADMKCRTLLKKEQPTNYYSYKKLITMVADIFGSDYENCGNILNVNNGILLNNKKFSEGDVEKIRLYELLLSLEKNKDIKINRITCNNCKFSVNIEFLKNPKDINSDIENWTVYYDLRINKDLGLGQYKNKTIRKFQKNSKMFKVLCYLIDRPNIVININELIEVANLFNLKAHRKLGKSAKEIEQIKVQNIPKYMEQIKESMKEAQRKLGILDDKERTIQISQAKPGFILRRIAKI